ncbi:hypothetical protein [Amphibacillus jilinensis]|uniref:hypothetical protein n=1 Tax=Amphibacillus jilinensis TaxID=1216008 RepID=UPI0002D4FC05|nr:hypothetical protein [Amphibacillus jilinensis]
MTTKKTPGFLSVSTSRGYKYVQLRRSVEVGKNEKTGKRLIKKIVLHTFGNYEKSLESMYGWLNNPETFPEKLIDLGYDLDDLQDWIMTLETKKTKTGKDFTI